MALLPTGFTPLNYIEADWQQYIDVPDINLNGIDFSFEFLIAPNLYRNWISFFCNSEGNGQYEASAGLDKRGTFRYSGVNSQAFNLNDNEMHMFYFRHEGPNKNYVYYDEVFGYPEQIREYEANTCTTDLHLRLFNNGRGSAFYAGKIYDVKLYVQDVLVHHFIPAEKDDNQTPGLYDLVTSTFYPSSSAVDFIAGSQKTLANITTTINGQGTVDVPLEVYTGEYMPIIANPATNYVFGGFWDSNNKLYTLNRNGVIFITGDTDIIVKFADASNPVSYISKTFAVYHSTGNTKTRQEDDTYVSSVTIGFPRVLKSFSDKTGATYGSLGAGCSGHIVGEATSSLVFNHYVDSYGLLTTLTDLNYIHNFFQAGTDLINLVVSTKTYNLRLVDTSTGYYFTICLMTVGDWGEGYFYDNEDNLLYSNLAVYSRTHSYNPTVFTTFGMVGYEDGYLTENSGIVVIRAADTGEQKRLVIASDQNGDVVTEPGMLKWFMGTQSVTPPTPPAPEDPNASMGYSEPGGGGGTHELVMDFTPITELPERISGISSEMLSIYQIPSTAVMTEIAGYLWSDDFTQSARRFLENSFDAIISLKIMPVQLTGTEVVNSVVYAGGARFLKPDASSIYADRVVNQYYIKNCGSIHVPLIWGSQMDYEPWTTVEIYLPYIGFQKLPVSEIMGKNLGLQYNIDLLTGDCVACIAVDNYLKYQFTGNCAAEIPFTGKFNDLTGIIRMVGGGLNMVSGSIGSGFTQLMGGAADTFIPDYRRGGQVSGNHGFISLQKPVLYLVRPNQNLPTDYNKFKGYPSHITAVLGDLSGYTEVEEIHLDNITATDEEKKELELLLKQGVIL